LLLICCRYRLTAAKRLLTIQLDEMKLLQQLSATKFKENAVSEVDIDSFERPKGVAGLVVFTLTSQEAGGAGDDDDGLEAPSHPAGGAAAAAAPARPQAAVSDANVRAASVDVAAAPTLRGRFASTEPAGSKLPGRLGLEKSSPRPTWAGRVGSLVAGAARTVAASRSGSSSGSGGLGDGEEEPVSGGNGTPYTRTKHFQFKTPEEADAFVECLCLAKALGPSLRGAFMALDVHRHGTVDAQEVVRSDTFLSGGALSPPSDPGHSVLLRTSTLRDRALRVVC
jgi:hypothetical protein